MSYQLASESLYQTNYIPPVDTDEESRWAQLFPRPIEFGSQVRAEYFPRLKGVFLAHGSYGAVSEPVLQVTQDWSRKIENDPVEFYYVTLFDYLVRSIRTVSTFMNASLGKVVLIPNAETGIATILNSLVNLGHTCSKGLKSGDTVLAFDFTYGGVLNALAHTCQVAGAKLYLISTSHPRTEDTIVKEFQLALKKVDRVRVFVFEHVSSPEPVLLPVAKLVSICRARNILSLVDGAHGIGQLELDLTCLDPDFYVSNPHKWLCHARGCSILYMKQEHDWVKPLVISWGAPSGLDAAFLWTGTNDYSPMLSLMTSIRFFEALNTNGRSWEYTRSLTNYASTFLPKVWNTRLLHGNQGLNMACVVVPTEIDSTTLISCDTYACKKNSLQDALKLRGIQVPIFSGPSCQYVRVSICVYNSRADIHSLANAILELTGRASLTELDQ